MMIPTDFQRFLEGGTTKTSIDWTIEKWKPLKAPKMSEMLRETIPEEAYSDIHTYTHTYIYIHVYTYIMNYIDISMIWMNSFSFCSVAWL